MVSRRDRGGQSQRVQDLGFFIDPDKKLLREIGSDISLIKGHISQAREAYNDRVDILDQLDSAERKLAKAGTYEDFEKIFKDINTIVIQASKGEVSGSDLVILSGLVNNFEKRLISLHQAGLIHSNNQKSLKILEERNVKFLRNMGSKAAIMYANRTANLYIDQKDPRSPTYGKTYQTTTVIRNRVFGYESTNPEIYSKVRESEEPVESVDTSKWITLNKIAQSLIQNATPVVAKQRVRHAKKLNTSNPVDVAATVMGMSILGESAGKLLALPPPKHPLTPPPQNFLPKSVVDSIQKFIPSAGSSPSAYVNPYYLAGNNPIHTPVASAMAGVTGVWPPPSKLIPSHSVLHGPLPYYKNPNQYAEALGPVNRPDLRGEKDKKGISKYLELLYRPVINLVKGIGDIAVESKKMELAMSSLATALGNPFDDATLGAITDFGSAGISTSIGGAGAIGSTISSVGGGVGRMANNWGHYGGDTGKAPPKGAKVVSAISAALGIVGGAISAVTGVVSAGFSISTSLLKSLNKITLKILGSSPLLETIKNILNLAFTMAFLPAMTLLESEMLPLFTNLLNSMVKFGNDFTKDFNKYIPAIVSSFGIVLSTMVQFFKDNSANIAVMVRDMIQLLPDMMKMQLGIIELFVNNKDKILRLADVTIDTLSKFIDQGLLDTLLEFATITMKFLSEHGIDMAKSVISLAKFIIGGAEWGTELKENIMKTGFGVDASGRMYSDLMNDAARSGDILGYFSNMGKGLANVLTLGQVHLASGGYVPATPGGVPAIIGEGGEGEYVIPESKLHNIGGLTVVFSGNVYGMNDFKQQVRSIMNEYTTKANFR